MLRWQYTQLAHTAPHTQQQTRWISVSQTTDIIGETCLHPSEQRATNTKQSHTYSTVVRSRCNDVVIERVPLDVSDSAAVTTHPASASDHSSSLYTVHSHIQYTWIAILAPVSNEVWSVYIEIWLANYFHFTNAAVSRFGLVSISHHELIEKPPLEINSKTWSVSIVTQTCQIQLQCQRKKNNSVKWLID